MNRLFRPRQSLPGRGTTRWTALELVLLTVSLLMIVLPLVAEGYRWINPRPAPAAPRAQAAPTFVQVNETPVNGPARVPTNTSLPITPTDITVTDTIGVVSPTPTTNVSPTPTTNVSPTPTTNVSPTPTTNVSPTPTTNVSPTPSPTTDPNVTPTPTVGEPPLSLEKIASVATVNRGERFSFAIAVFSNSATARTITVRDVLDSQLTVVSASSPNGDCTSAQTVQCTVTAQRDQPATINITVEVQTSATAGGQIVNQASAQDNLSNSAASDQVIVNISQDAPVVTVTPGGPTDTPTDTPIGPTSTFTPTPDNPQPTLTVTPGGPTNTPTTEAPTNTPGGEQPTRPPRDDDDGDDQQPAPPADVVLPPVAAPIDGLPPGALPAPQPVQPTSVTRPGTRPRPAAPTATPTASATPAPATATAQAAAVAREGLSLQMGSDYGSAFPGTEVYYVIAVQNNRPAGSGAFSGLVLSSTLPANLEVLGAESDPAGRDVDINGNTILVKRATLAAGESLVVGIRTRIKADVLAGTRLIAQAQLGYDGLQFPARSNLVVLEVVGAPAIQVGVAQANQTATAMATATPAPSATPTASATPTPSMAPAASAPVPMPPEAAGAVAAQPAAPTAMAPLPETSAGIPIGGVALLGMTLMVRTVRLRRDRSRI